MKKTHSTIAANHRQEANALGLPTYHGNPCVYCQSTEHYTKSQACTSCYNTRRQHTDFNRRKYQIFARVKNQAKFSHTPFTITFNELEWPDVCPVLGTKLDYWAGQTRNNAVTFDRVDSRKGYVPGNVRVISHRANSWKSSMTVQDLERILEYVHKSSSH